MTDLSEFFGFPPGSITSADPNAKIEKLGYVPAFSFTGSDASSVDRSNVGPHDYDSEGFDFGEAFKNIEDGAAKTFEAIGEAVKSVFHGAKTVTKGFWDWLMDMIPNVTGVVKWVLIGVAVLFALIVFFKFKSIIF